MSFSDRFTKDEMRGVRYAVNVFIATTVLYVVVKKFGGNNPIWAISSMVATSDPHLKQSLTTFRGRLINTLVGCAIGLLCIVVGRTEWELPTALALTVIVSTYMVQVPTMWRQAPITAAMIVAGGLQHHDKLVLLEQGAMRVAEVLFGCVVGIGSAWLLSTVWPLHDPALLKKA